jgi:hypothetical protein
MIDDFEAVHLFHSPTTIVLAIITLFSGGPIACQAQTSQPESPYESPPESPYVATHKLTASGRDKEQGTNRSAIVLCTSDDGMKWIVRRKILDDGTGGRDFKSLDGCWIPIDGRNFLIYALRSQAESKGNRTIPVRLHISEGDQNWRSWKYRGIFYEPKADYPDDAAARGFSWLTNDPEPILLYEAGQNRKARIAVLRLKNGKVTTSK